MADQRLIDYVKKGLKQGFNVDYIEEVLLKHGYKIGEVNDAMMEATAPIPETAPPKNNNKSFMIAGALFAGIILLFLLFSVQQGKNNITGHVVSDVDSELTLQDYLDKVGELSDNIDKKETTIEEQIGFIKELQFSVDEKDQVVSEIERLYKAIKKEREEVKDTLVELLQEIIERSHQEH